MTLPMGMLVISAAYGNINITMNFIGVDLMKKEALWYVPLDSNNVRCLLCPHNCYISEGKSGICKVRYNDNGILYNSNFNKLTALAMDPIEKKPLFHFHEGKYLLSIGTFGCNFKCDFCQNHRISQGHCSGEDLDINWIINTCKKHPHCVGVAYTYNEPSIWYETVLECAKVIKSHGFVNVLVTNGYINKEPLLELLPYIDAMNIDVKSMENKFYKDFCGGSLEPVIKTVETAINKCHVEVTCLIIPGLNDNEDDMVNLSKWLASFNPSTPLHINRYYPSYNMDIPATDPKALIKLKKVAKKHLENVYIGNVPGLQ